MDKTTMGWGGKMKWAMAAMAAVGFAAEVGASEYDASWMDDVTWTRLSNYASASPFEYGEAETRNLYFTGTVYLKLSSSGSALPLVLNGNVHLTNGNRLSTGRTAIVGGTTTLDHTIWMGASGQKLEVSHATVDSSRVGSFILQTGSTSKGWSIDLYDGAVWKPTVQIQIKEGGSVLNPEINVRGGTFAPADLTSYGSVDNEANFVKKLTVNFFDGAVFDGKTTSAGSSVHLNIEPDAQVTFKTASSNREISSVVIAGEGSVTRVVKFDNGGPDNNRYKLTNYTTGGGLSGAGDFLVTTGACLDLRPTITPGYTGTVTVEQGGKFMFPGYRGVRSSPDAKVVFRGGTVGESKYGNYDPKLTNYCGRVEIESWEVASGFAFGDSPATVALKPGCVFDYGNLADLALLTGGAAGGKLVLETNSTVKVTLPLSAESCPQFFGTRTIFPNEGKAKLQVAFESEETTMEEIYTLGTGYPRSVLNHVAAEFVGIEDEKSYVILRVCDGMLQVKKSRRGTCVTFR